MIKNKKGFTLIELLVVISIIGLLSTLAMVSLSNARIKTRDARRMAELRQVEKALQLYYDKNGQYPPACGSAYNIWRGHGSNFGDCNTNYIMNISEFLSPLPIDPSGDNTNGYLYRVSTNGVDFKIMAHTTAEATVTSGHPFARCPSSCSIITYPYCAPTNVSFIHNFAIYTPGANCW